MASTLVTTNELTGARVVGGANGTKRIGKVRRFVFHPKEKRCIGFIVKRPDLLWMFRRKDLFVPIDGYDLVDGRIVIRPDAKTNGPAACRAMGIDWDSCVLWVGMPVMTEDGAAYGTVGNVTFNRVTGTVDSFETDNGATSNALLGTRAVPASMMRGFRQGMGAAIAQVGSEGVAVDAEDTVYGAILVSNEVRGVASEGGVAEKAGQATAVAMDKVQSTVDKAKPVVSEAAKKTGEAVNKGAYATGRQISKSKTMFSDFKKEYDKAVASDGPAAKKPAALEGEQAAGSPKPAAKKPAATGAKKKPAPKKKNMFASFKDEYDKARRGE